MKRALLTLSIIALVALIAQPATAATVFSDSFEPDVSGTTPPTGWTQGGTQWTDGWTVYDEAGYNSIDGATISGGTGSNVLVADGEDSWVYTSFDITGYETQDMTISVLANDHGQADGTWEAGDTFYVEYAYGASTPTSWTVAITATEDFVPGEESAETFAAFSGSGGNPGGESTMWIRLRQDTNHTNVEGVVVDDLEVTAVPEPATMSLLAFGGLGVLVRRRR
jgi:hypothetical protein